MTYTHHTALDVDIVSDDEPEGEDEPENEDELEDEDKPELEPEPKSVKSKRKKGEKT